MAWSTPSSKTTGTLITAATWNQDVKDNSIALRGGALTGLVVSGTGPHVIGGSTNDYTRLLLDGAFTSGGASTVAYGIHVDGALTGHSGDSAAIAGTKLDNNIVRAGACTTIAQLWVSEPTITGSGTVTNSATVYIEGAATEATNDYALLVNAGAVKINSSLAIGATAVAAGADALAVGTGALCAGDNSASFGYEASTTGDSSFTAGYTSLVSGDHSIALGYNMTVSGDHSTGLGYLGVVSSDHSVLMTLSTTTRTLSTGGVFSVMDGNVGINTLAPSVNLEASGSLSSGGTEEVFRISGNTGGTQNSTLRATATYAASAAARYFGLDSIDEQDQAAPLVLNAIGGANVGIGVLTPAYLLDIRQATGTNYLKIADTRSTTGDSAGFLMGTGGAPTGAAKSLVAHIETGANGIGDMVFAVDAANDSNDAVLADEKMRIMSSGNVGIATSTPGTNFGGGTADYTSGPTLEINGGARGALLISGTTDAQALFGDSGNSADNRKAGIGYDTGILSLYHVTDANYGRSASGLSLLNNGNVIIGAGRSAGTGSIICGPNSASGYDASYPLTVTYTGSSHQGAAFYDSVTDSVSREAIWFRRYPSSSWATVGSISTTNSATAYATSSDYRLKENETPFDDALDLLGNLKPYKFNFKINDPSVISQGFFAHEAAEVVPQAVGGEKDAVDDDGKMLPQSIDHSHMVPLLTAAIQELAAKVEALESL